MYAQLLIQWENFRSYVVHSQFKFILIKKDAMCNTMSRRPKPITIPLTRLRQQLNTKKNIVKRKRNKATILWLRH